MPFAARPVITAGVAGSGSATFFGVLVRVSAHGGAPSDSRAAPVRDCCEAASSTWPASASRGPGGGATRPASAATAAAITGQRRRRWARIGWCPCGPACRPRFPDRSIVLARDFRTVTPDDYLVASPATWIAGLYP